MSNRSNVQEPDPKHPASLCRLRVAGVIPPDWENRLGSIRVAHEEATEPPATTTLMGPVTDQAALLGVLNTLPDLRLRLISVECLDTETS